MIDDRDLTSSLREVLLTLLSDPEFERELARRRMFVKLGPPLSRASDFVEDVPGAVGGSNSPTDRPCTCTPSHMCWVCFGNYCRVVGGGL